MKRFTKLTLMMAWCCVGLMATPSFATLPANGVVSGEPGLFAGWGFTITNDTSFFLFFDNSAFCGPGGDPFLNSCTPTYDGSTNFGPAFGTYTDFIANNLTFIAPNSTLSQTFDPIAQTGVGEYNISPSAPVPSQDPSVPGISNLFIQYEEFDGDPLTTGNQVPGTGEFELEAPVEVLITPEPGTLTLAGGAIVLLAAWKRRRRT